MNPRRLEDTIRRAGIKKSALARAVHVTPGTLSRYLSGQIKPDPPVLALLAQQLHVSVEYLLGDSGEAATLADQPVVSEMQAPYIPDAVALTGLDAEERQTVLRLLQALRSGDDEIRRHLIGQLKIIETAVQSRQQQPRAETKDGA